MPSLFLSLGERWKPGKKLTGASLKSAGVRIRRRRFSRHPMQRKNAGLSLVASAQISSLTMYHSARLICAGMPW